MPQKLFQPTRRDWLWTRDEMVRAGRWWIGGGNGQAGQTRTGRGTRLVPRYLVRRATAYLVNLSSLELAHSLSLGQAGHIQSITMATGPFCGASIRLNGPGLRECWGSLPGHRRADATAWAEDRLSEKTAMFLAVTDSRGELVHVLVQPITDESGQVRGVEVFSSSH